MRRSEHTPGPWQVVTPDDPTWPLEIWSHDWMVATVPRRRHLSPNDTEALSTARLFVAAPELLAALKEVESLLSDRALDDRAVAILNDVRNAIDKAEAR